MNYSSVVAAASAALLLIACGPSEAELAAQREKAVADSLAAAAAAEHVYSIDPANSRIEWKGTMLGVKSHYGTIAITDGKMTVQGGMPLSGSFAVDMSAINPLDTNYAPDDAKQGTKSMLIGHLQSPDFFDVATFPSAEFTITGASGTTITGDLTLRGQTHSETVTDVVITEENGILSATGKLTFDRQKYGAAWSSGAKDMVLNDNIELNIELSGKAE
ncbi:MAG: YceI family protein [Flavobacteriales bacterium]|nr:YceI family protein [Flavobacteriales bacterium]